MVLPLEELEKIFADLYGLSDVRVVAARATTDIPATIHVHGTIDGRRISAHEVLGMPPQTAVLACSRTICEKTRPYRHS